MYLGTLGRLIEIKCPTSLQSSRSGGFSFSTTLEGKVKAQALPGGRRVWDVELGQLTTPADLQTLEQFVAGAWGPGPFVFVPTDALVTNVLSPGVASCDPAAGMGSNTSPDGPMLTPDGWAARTVRVNSTNNILWFGDQYFPVIPGAPMTFAAYLLGPDAAARVYWYDENLNQLTFHTSDVTATSGSVVRSWRTVTPPEGAVSFRVRAVNAFQGAWPSVTWTDKLMPPSPGHGCLQAVVHGGSKGVVRATGTQQFYSTGFTVTEVG